jgi:catechol 2,3-dioxygenase-like lactoylglutathione lyase family enzyme
MQFPTGATVQQVRIARPTDQFDAIIRFYRDALELDVLRLWRHGPDGDHKGYDGVIFGLPNTTYHLEFTHHVDGSPGPAPSLDNLLVLYMPERADVDATCDRLQQLGHEPVPSENPWWDDGGITFEDPDGWRVVIMHGAGLAG